MSCIDLNCDMGESFGAWTMGADAAVMPWVTSVNIACGFHAGDPSTMRRTVVAAVAADVAIGAHIGLPDLAGFGRRSMAISTQQAHDMTVVQLGALSAMAHVHGARLSHMKPHGALYHMAESDPALADALARALHDVDTNLRLVGRAGGRLCEAGQGIGLATSHEVFADRRYQADGTLVPRTHANAVIDDVQSAAQQALDLALRGTVTAIDGSRITVQADTICLHGDRDNAESFARTVHQTLRDAGVSMRHP